MQQAYAFSRSRHERGSAAAGTCRSADNTRLSRSVHSPNRCHCTHRLAAGASRRCAQRMARHAARHARSRRLDTDGARSALSPPPAQSGLGCLAETPVPEATPDDAATAMPLSAEPASRLKLQGARRVAREWHAVCQVRVVCRGMPGVRCLPRYARCALCGTLYATCTSRTGCMWSVVCRVHVVRRVYAACCNAVRCAPEQPLQRRRQRCETVHPIWNAAIHLRCYLKRVPAGCGEEHDAIRRERGLGGRARSLSKSSQK